MRFPLIALAAAALVAAPLALTAPPASAATCTAPRLTGSSISPRRVTLGVATPKGFVVTVGVAKNGCTVTSVDTDFFTPTGGTDTFSMAEGETTDGITTYDVGIRVNPGAVPNADAGRWTSAVYITWGSKNTNDDGAALRVQRAARLSTNATPEPVAKGRTLTVRGTLKRANWETLRYAGYAKQPVVLQFRTLRGSYANVRTVTSDSHGKVTAAVKADRDGCYRFVFRGTSTTAHITSVGDCVDVR